MDTKNIRDLIAKVNEQGRGALIGGGIAEAFLAICDQLDTILPPDPQVQSDWNQSNNTKVDFIKNKPTIPAAQVQSDWNQSDDTQLDYIKNKPTIPEGAVIMDAIFASGSLLVDDVSKIVNAVRNGKVVYLRYEHNTNIDYAQVLFAGSSHLPLAAGFNNDAASFIGVEER